MNQSQHKRGERAARGRLLWVALGWTILVIAVPSRASELPFVPPADLSALHPADLRDTELDLPFYLAHFHRVANSVRSSGESRGFIDIPVWRARRENHPGNARIMESALSLAYFYCTDQPWNPYRGDPALRARLEAALDYWCRMQLPNGHFNGPDTKDGLTGVTAFEAKFMAATLEMLDTAPPLDPALHTRLAAAVQNALYAVLLPDHAYALGRRFANQYSNIWAAGLCLFAIHPDADLEDLWRARLATSVEDHQSPAGYFYEERGPDWGYSMGTEQSNLRMAWHYARDTNLGPVFIEKQKRWCEWLSYNAVREPGGHAFVLNRSIETRTVKHSFEHLNSPFAEVIPLMRAFSENDEEHRARMDAARKRLERRWPRVDSLSVGSFAAYTPYRFLLASRDQWFPTDEQKREAISRLPYLAQERFIHQRTDNQKPISYTFVRRPRYYAAFAAGKRLTGAQRYGLTLLWSPQAGALMQSQTKSRDAAWGTMLHREERVREAGDLEVAYLLGDQESVPQPGCRDLPEGTLTVRYALRLGGTKEVRFEENEIVVVIRQRGQFTEYLPLLTMEDDELRTEAGLCELFRGRSVLRIVFAPALTPSVGKPGRRVASKRLVTLAATAADSLTYRIQFMP